MRALDKERQFAAAIEQQRDALYRVCCAYAHDDADRQDIYQETLIHIWNSLEGFRGQSALRTWMYRVAVNTCLGWLRREQRRSRLLEQVGREQSSAAAVTAVDPPEAAAGDVAELYACIARLAPVDRLLVSLHLEEMTTGQIAEVLGISEGNVRVKLFRIKNQLRAMWEKENYEPR